MKIILTVLFLNLASIMLNAQEKETGDSWFFIQITDPQFGMYENNAGFEKETALYEKAVAEINQLKPDFVVITGDFVHNGKDKAQITEFKRITAEIRKEIPVYYTPGNHDVGNKPDRKSIKAYIKNYGYDKFAFMHKGALFIGFNSSLIKNDRPKAEQKQFNWLKKMLQKNQNANQIILFCHYPFFIHSFDEQETYSNISPEKREKYLSLFKENNVEAIFSGHYHNNAITEFEGIQLITTSAAGKPLGEAPSGFRIVKVYNDRIEHKYYGLEDVPANLNEINLTP